MVKQKSISEKEALKLGNAAAAKGNKAKAEKYFNAVLDKYPDNKDAIKGIKNLNPNNLYRDDLDELHELLKNHQYREVEVKAGLYLERYPEVAELWSLLGVAIGARSDHEQALSCFEKAAKLAPNNASVLFNLANSYNELGEDEKADEYLEKAKALQPVKH